MAMGMAVDRRGRRGVLEMRCRTGWGEISGVRFWSWGFGARAEAGGGGVDGLGAGLVGGREEEGERGAFFERGRRKWRRGTPWVGGRVVMVDVLLEGLVVDDVARNGMVGRCEDMALVLQACQAVF